MIQVFDSGEMFNPICHGEIFKCQGGKALSQPVTVVGSTGEESWKCILSTSNLQWPKKTFCEAQTCLAVAVTIDHLHLAFTTKSVWIQRYNLFQQSALRTARVPHSASGRQMRHQEMQESTSVSVPNVLIQDYVKRAFPQQFPENQSLTNSCGNRSQAQRTNLTVFPDAG